jgi:AraC-like DNA-binding protein
MFIIFEERLSDSPFVERVWRCHSERAGTFHSIAMNNWEMVMTKYAGRLSVTVRGPETKATRVYCPAGGEWLAIRFKLGTFMPHLPASSLVDGAVTVPEATQRSFWLHGAAWQYPTYDNADTFVDRLVRDGLLVREPVVATAVQRQRTDLSPRSIQRRFMYATGLTHGAARQIERARHATYLLKHGVSILDTVAEAGYYDQPHLTRSLKHFVGQTPAQLSCPDNSEQLSFLYKTPGLFLSYD